MYHFLGIVEEEDLKNGNIVPSYILCQSHGDSAARSGWRVIKQTEDSPFKNMNKVLVKTLSGNEDMIDFLCGYRTRDHMHGDKRYKHEETKKYYPKGALFWFACNRYGEPGDYAILITKIPIQGKFSDGDAGFRRLLSKQNEKPLMSSVLSSEPNCEMNVYSHIKPKLFQGR